MNNGWANSGPSREVRVERWRTRAFYVSPCRFFIDVPLDMSGIILSASREAMNAGYQVVPGGVTLATDSLLRGAVLVEIERGRQGDPNILTLDGELLARALPDKGLRLRGELDELVRWSSDLGYAITHRFVEYAMRGATVKPTAVYAIISGDDALIESTRG